MPIGLESVPIDLRKVPTGFGEVFLIQKSKFSLRRRVRDWKKISPAALIIVFLTIVMIMNNDYTSVE